MLISLKTYPRLGNLLKKAAALSGLALQMSVIIAVGTIFGIYLDDKFPNKNNIFSLFLTLFSVLISVFYVILRINRISKKENK